MKWVAGGCLLVAWVLNLAGFDLTTVIVPLVGALVVGRWAVES